MKQNRFEKYIGKKFHKLTAIGRTNESIILKSSGEKKGRYWLFLCECGAEKKAPISEVVRGNLKSCGCNSDKFLKGEESLARQVYIETYKDGDLTFEQYKEMSQLNCHYCNCPPSNVRKSRKRTRHGKEKQVLYEYVSSGIDRKDSNLPHDFDNCVPCCWNCNSRKRAMPYHDFLNWIKDIYLTRVVKEI